MQTPEDAYLTLKLAGQLFAKLPGALSTEERQRVANVAARQQRIEQRVLGTPEAARVVVAPSSVDRSVTMIRGRYDSDSDFLADLAGNGLDEAGLREAVARDLAVEAVLEAVAGRVGRVADTDVEIFYLTHRQRFCVPERRLLRHILVTVSDVGGATARVTALAKIEGIHRRLADDGTRFEQEALAHSECPTAMQGGVLGKLPRGQLFPELEPAAFALAVGEISGVLESPLGFHILRCDAIEAERDLRFDEVRKDIRHHLEDTRRAKAQKEWIAGLFRAV